MTPIMADKALLLAVLLFAIGVGGLVMRRNLVFMLMSIEIMVNAAGLAFVAAGAQWLQKSGGKGQPDGQVMFLFILAVAAAEVAVGLAMIIKIHRQKKTLDSDSVSDLRG